MNVQTKNKAKTTSKKTTKTATYKEVLASRFKFLKPKDEIDKAIQAFLTGETSGQYGRYFIHDNMLVYKTVVTDEIKVLAHQSGLVEKHTEHVKENLTRLISQVESLEIDLVSHSLEQLKNFHGRLSEGKSVAEIDYYSRIDMVKYRSVKANLIAKRIDPVTYIGNSSTLSLIGRTVSFGNEKLNRNETDIQRRLSALIPMIPFTVFIEAGLDLDKYKLVDRGDEESVIRNIENYDSKKRETVLIPETVHFTGASLFEVDGKTYLFDIDRREIAEKIFNPFLAEIPVAAKTIAEAYEALKPTEVKEAELAGLQVIRQGEWFFIPVKGNFKADKNPNHRPNSGVSDWNPVNKRGILQAGRNRPNHVTLFNEAKSLFSGIVTHSGREHAPLELKGWFRAVPNTATNSFTITGDID